MTRKRKGLIGLGIVLVVLVIARLLAPAIVTRVANDKLAAMPEYTGHVDTVGLSLWRGAYRPMNLVIAKRDAPRGQPPLLALREVDIQLDWKALFHGKIVARVKLLEPRVNLVVAPKKAHSTTTPPMAIADTLLDLVALDINVFQVVDGRLAYLDESRDPRVDVHLAKIDVMIHDLRTRPGERPEKRPTRGEMTASVQKSGIMRAGMSANMFAPKHPEVDAELSLKHLPLPELRDFTRAYAGFDFEAGTLDLYSELAVGDEEVRGYVKPIISGKKVVDLKGNDRGDNIAEVAWEAFVGAVTSMLENKSTDAIATRVTFRGPVGKPNVSTWGAVWSLVGNAFLKAILPGVENRVSLASSGGEVRPYIADKSAHEQQDKKDEGKEKEQKQAEKERKKASREAVKSEKQRMDQRANEPEQR